MATIFEWMREISSKNFGLLIAYLLPGFTLVWGASHVSPTLQFWLGTEELHAPTIGGFLNMTLFSIGAGLTASTVRWLFIDSLHHVTGIGPPAWNFARIAENISALETLIEIHYRYYQWYANMLIALPMAGLMRWSKLGVILTEVIGVTVLMFLFFWASRDTLTKYYLRLSSMDGQKLS